MDCLSVFNPSRLLISSLNISLSFSIIISLFFTQRLCFHFFFLNYGCTSSSNWLIVPSFRLICTNRSIIRIVSSRAKTWILPSLLNSWSILHLWTSNGWHGFKTQTVQWTVKGRGSRFLRSNWGWTEVWLWWRNNYFNIKINEINM